MTPEQVMMMQNIAEKRFSISITIVRRRGGSNIKVRNILLSK
jgi:hypothetical protein